MSSMKPAEATAEVSKDECDVVNNDTNNALAEESQAQTESCGCCQSSQTDAAEENVQTDAEVEAEAQTEDKNDAEQAQTEKAEPRVTEIKIPAVEESSQSWLSKLITKGERKLSELSSKNNFWHRLTSWIFLPLAFRSGIKIHHGDVGTFSAILPFRRHNRNWYSAMAGGALLANAEVAGGMYVFQKCGADYTVVCKQLTYKFLRPCYGPAVYRIETEEDIDALIATGEEFNLTVKMNIVQMVNPSNKRQRRVGRSTAHFHITPKTHYRKRRSVWMKRAADGKVKNS
ncbi:hypothetical protein JD969_13790 [Planctomycetota bacterium]|nr:hypothetical protein JD969_13790 [Planctomycetota bacterium]